MRYSKKILQATGYDKVCKIPACASSVKKRRETYTYCKNQITPYESCDARYYTSRYVKFDKNLSISSRNVLRNSVTLIQYTSYTLSDIVDVSQQLLTKLSIHLQNLY